MTNDVNARLSGAPVHSFYPSKDLLTARDWDLISNYRSLVFHLEIGHRKQVLDAEKTALMHTRVDIKNDWPVSNPHHAHLHTLDDVEDAEAELEEAMDELNQESNELQEATTGLVLKREGYLAGIRQAVAVLRSGNQAHVLDLLQALSDEEYADRALYAMTWTMPNHGGVDVEWQRFFPLAAPVAAARYAQAAAEEAIKVRVHLEKAEADLADAEAARLPDDPHRKEMEAIFAPYAHMGYEPSHQALVAAGFTDEQVSKMWFELGDLRKPVYREGHIVGELKRKLESLMKRAAATGQNGGAE